MGGKTPKQPVTDYTMSVHAGVCAGPVDAFLAIYTGEKVAWEGEITEQKTEIIHNVELYGGVKKEGGVEGTVHFLPGGPAQLMPEPLAAKFGLTPATMPGYRGLASVFFYGGLTTPDPTMTPEQQDFALLFLTRGVIGGLASAQQTAFVQSYPNGVKGKAGFYWQSNNPQLKTIWVKVRRRPVGLLDENSLIADASQIVDSNSVTQQIINYDANPSHMIYECLTNTDWGLGLGGSAINTDSFLTAAATLFDEQFGLSMLWVKASTIEDMISEIIDHIQATIYVNPRDGLITLKLLRDDYVAEDAPLFTPSNCLIQKFARKGEGEIINEVTVTYTNPLNEEDSTITQQNLAGIASAGGIVHTDRNYYGIRNVNLAAKILNREVRVVSAPLAKCEMITSRKGWSLVPGDVLRLTYPEHRLSEVVFRVGSIDYGKPGDYAIRVQLVEDVFGYNPGNYTIPGGSQWVDPSQPPDTFDQQQAVTLPYVLAKLVDTDVGTYPNSLLGVLGGTDNIDAAGFDLQVETAQPDATLSYGFVGALSTTARAVTAADFDQEAETVIAAFPTHSTGPEPVVGGFMILGDGDDTEREWCYIKETTEDSNSGLNGYRLQRGIMDTTPKAWPAGTQIWFIDPTVVFYDTNLWPAGSTENYKLLMRTSLGLLPVDEAPVLAAEAGERPHLPYRPADVKVEGTAWASPADPLDATAAITLTIDWANRNRDTEDFVILGWTDASVTPPAGQTTTVTVLSPGGAVWTTIDGLTGTTYELDPAAFMGPTGVVRVTSKLGGFEFLQGHEISVKVRAGGYGLDYGFNYGGS